MTSMTFTKTAAPQWLLAMWEEIDDKTFGKGMDCFAEDAICNLGVADWHGREAIRNNLRQFIDKVLGRLEGEPGVNCSPDEVRAGYQARFEAHQSSAELQEVRAAHAAQQARHSEERRALRARHDENRKRRRAQREALEASGALTEAARHEALHSLDQLSRGDKAERRRAELRGTTG